MPTTPRGRSVLVVLLALLPLLWGAPASAHSALIDSTPKNESTVETLPESIELRFNESLSDISPALVLRQGEETIAELEPRVDGPVLRAEAPQDLPDGDYTAVWRVVSADGHPVDGVVAFTIAGGGDAAATEPTPDASEPTPSAEPTEEPDTSDEATENTAAESDDGAPTTLVIVLVAAALVAAAALVWFLRRRTPAGADAGSEADSPARPDAGDES